MSLTSLNYENKKKKTRREKFAEEMDKVIPWAELLWMRANLQGNNGYFNSSFKTGICLL
jgi:hypothetical protein